MGVGFTFFPAPKFHKEKEKELWEPITGPVSPWVVTKKIVVVKLSNAL